MKLSEIHIYPIKSCHGISVAEAVVEERGLQFDRRWMLVDENNRFLTQREFPVMATLRTEVTGDELRVTGGGASIAITAETQRRGEEKVTVWSSRVLADVYSDEVNEFFSDALGARVRLVAMTEAKRPVNYWYRVHAGDNVSFADGYPFLLAGQASLDELNRRIAENGGGGDLPPRRSAAARDQLAENSLHFAELPPRRRSGDTPPKQGGEPGAAGVPMNRFRPNFVVEGSEPFAEDTWKKVRIGGTIFHVVKPCARCPIPTIDQETGERHSNEPTRTLATFRTKRRAGKNKILFGQNLIADTPGGTVRVGDSVEVLEVK